MNAKCLSFYMKFKFSLIKAKFIDRPNRFITIIQINGVRYESHLADPGRLNELLIPGADLLVRKIKNLKNRKTKFSTIMVNHKGQLISLVSVLPNDFVKHRLRRKKIPFLKNYNLVRSIILVKLKFIDKPNFKTIILKSIIKTPGSPLLVPAISKFKLVRKKSLTTPFGNSHPIKFPITPPIIAPEKRPIIISGISRFFIIELLN